MCTQWERFFATGAGVNSRVCPQRKRVVSYSHLLQHSFAEKNEKQTRRISKEHINKHVHFFFLLLLLLFSSSHEWFCGLFVPKKQPARNIRFLENVDCNPFQIRILKVFPDVVPLSIPGFGCTRIHDREKVVAGLEAEPFEIFQELFIGYMVTQGQHC